MRAENPGRPIIAGLTIAADQTAGVYDLMFDLGALLTSKAVAAGPILTVSGVSFLNEASTNSKLVIGGFSKATVTNIAVSGIVRSALQLTDDADVTLVGGTIDGGKFGAPVFGAALLTVANRASLVLDGTTVQNTLFPGIFVNGDTLATPAKLTLRNDTTFDTVGSADDCSSSGAVVAGQTAAIVVDHSTLKGCPGSALCVSAGAANVSLKVENGTAIANNLNGINMGTGAQASAAVTVADTMITGNTGYGIRWMAIGTFSLSTSTISGSADGLFISGGATGLTFTARNIQLKTNGYGMDAFVSNLGDLTLDLGTGASPGGNTITGNTTSGMSFSVGAGVVGDAQGNTWNPSIENADGAGHYTAGTAITGPSISGTNYVLPNLGTLNL